MRDSRRGFDRQGEESEVLVCGAGWQTETVKSHFALQFNTLLSGPKHPAAPADQTGEEGRRLSLSAPGTARR